MLQAPSHLPRVCGHSHMKKFWLTQIQNESKTSETSSCLPPSCSRLLGSPAISADCKQNQQWNSAGSSLLIGVTPPSRAARSTVSGAVTVSGGNEGAADAQRVCLATCAKSLSLPRSFDQPYRSLQTSSPYIRNCTVEKTYGPSAVDVSSSSPFKVPYSEDISASSSRCGSPSVDPDPCYALRDVAENVCGEDQLRKAANVNFASEGGRHLSSDRKNYCSSGEENGYMSPEERVTQPKCGSNALLELENSDSGTDPGDSGYARGAVPSFRAVELQRGGTSLDVRPDYSNWTPIVPALKEDCERIRIPDACTRDLSSSDHDFNPENESIAHNSIFKVCSLCGTTKTPLWRSGPHGPKSLCNACGIRFKKSRRCSSHGENSDLLASSPSGNSASIRPSHRPLKRKHDSFLPCEAHRLREIGADIVAMEASFRHQKRSKWAALTGKRDSIGYTGERAGISGESCITWSFLPSSESPSARELNLSAQMKIDLKKLQRLEGDGRTSRSFSKEDEEAALLLMYLSCGFVYA